MGLVRSEQLTHFCIPIVTYGLSVFPWTKQEVVQFYVTTRRILSQTANNHPSNAIEHLYLPVDAGMIKVENFYYR